MSAERGNRDQRHGFEANIYLLLFLAGTSRVRSGAHIVRGVVGSAVLAVTYGSSLCAVQGESSGKFFLISVVLGQELSGWCNEQI